MANLQIKQMEKIAERKVYEVLSHASKDKFLASRLKKLMQEIKDTDEAIQIYEKEKKEGRLKKIKSLSEIF